MLAKLGELWRAISRHAGELIENEEAYKALGSQIEKALGQLDALSEKGALKPDTAAALGAAFRERHQHVHRVRYVRATCYEPTTLGDDMYRSRASVEEQTKVLDELAKEGKLTPQAEAKARQAIAREVAFQTKLRQLWYGADLTGDYENPSWEAEKELHTEYREGKIGATQASGEAAKMLVEFTVQR